jgi:hypothetical protein
MADFVSVGFAIEKTGLNQRLPDFMHEGGLAFTKSTPMKSGGEDRSPSRRGTLRLPRIRSRVEARRMIARRR